MVEIIITEKFSVASDFAKALGVKQKFDGYFKNEQTIITWAVGHLVELWEPEDYDPNLKKWRIETLPVIPERFKYKPISKTYKQFNIIKSLLDNDNIDRVVIATDAGREGEVIARTILLESGFTDKERIFRFWTSQALVPEVVRKNMNELKPLSHYDRLWRAGYYRQVADWLVGMNCTRMVTLRLRISGELFSVGRVQTAVLSLIVDRKRERDRFVPEIYWIIKVLFSNPKGKWTGYWFQDKKIEGSLDSVPDDLKNLHALKKKEDVDRILKKIKQSKSGVVKSIKKENKKEPPPFLFSLTDLQQEANKRFGFSAQITLDIAQTLYQDKKCLSYPRTDSRVLGTQNLDMVKNILSKLELTYQNMFFGVDSTKISLSNKRVFNDAKLTDHHALIPFKPLPPDATYQEHSIFNLVLSRFIAAFYPDCEFENTKVITELEGETFQTNGKVVIVDGWRAVYQEETQDSDKLNLDSKKRKKSSSDSLVSSGKAKHEEIVENIPALAKGDIANCEKIVPEEKKTTAPPDYTDSLILKDMTNPSKYVEEEEIKKLYRGDVGIGTQATRAQIIETLINRKYIERSGKKLIATEKGVFLVDILRKSPLTSVLTSPEETARWEMSLNTIALGEPPSDKNAIEAVTSSHEESNRNAIKNFGQIPATSFLAHIKEFVAKAVNELKLAKFDHVFKPSDLNRPTGKNSKPQELVKQSDKNLKSQEQSKESKKNLKKTNLPKPPLSDNCVCPLCGGNIIEGKKGYGCSNWRAENGNCRFVIWKEIMGKVLTEQHIQTLVSGKTTKLYVLRDAQGNKFKAKLKMVRKDNKNYSIEIIPESRDIIMSNQNVIQCLR
ncbi:MAG: hypothetical protein HQK72_01510 [Desulfamplus sp.]|nr:hypothetical protein [Desulfamplus sp.]